MSIAKGIRQRVVALLRHRSPAAVRSGSDVPEERPGPSALQPPPKPPAAPDPPVRVPRI